MHKMKNIKNDLLRARIFVFPGFDFELLGMNLSSSPGYMNWQDIHKNYDKDKKQQANLEKETKLSYKALYSVNIRKM